MPGRALNSSIEPVQARYKTFWPFTFISKAMLPTEAMRWSRWIWVRASRSWTTSAVADRRGSGCARADVGDVSSSAVNIAEAADHQLVGTSRSQLLEPALDDHDPWTSRRQSLYSNESSA